MASSIKGLYSKVAASKVSTLIEDTVKAGVTGEGDTAKLPSQIVIELDSRLLDGMYLGLTEVALEEKVTAQDIKVIGSIAKIIKCKSRFEAFLEKHLESLPVVEEALDVEELEIPLDAE